MKNVLDLCSGGKDNLVKTTNWNEKKKRKERFFFFQAKTFLLHYALPPLVAVFAYVNSLGGDFVHDDVAAIVRNPDVSNPNSPWEKILVNDFWGFPIHSNLSHKSYRPITTLLFRYVRATFPLQCYRGRRRMGEEEEREEEREKREKEEKKREREGKKKETKERRKKSEKKGEESEPTTRERKLTIQPTNEPTNTTISLFRFNYIQCAGGTSCFHVTNIVLHAAVTSLFRYLLFLLLQPKEREKERGKERKKEREKERKKEQMRIDASSKTRCCVGRPIATFAAVLFALHPIHTEAVSSFLFLHAFLPLMDVGS